MTEAARAIVPQRDSTESMLFARFAADVRELRQDSASARKNLRCQTRTAGPDRNFRRAALIRFIASVTDRNGRAIGDMKKRLQRYEKTDRTESYRSHASPASLSYSGATAGCFRQCRRANGLYPQSGARFSAHGKSTGRLHYQLS